MLSGVKRDEATSYRAADVTIKMESCSIKKSPSTDIPTMKSVKQVTESREGDNNEESVEVILGEEGKGSKVMEDASSDKSKTAPDQNVFRHPQTMRPMPGNAPGVPAGPPPPPPTTNMGHPPPPPPHHAPYPIQQHHHHHQSHHPSAHPYPPPPHHSYYPYPHGSGSWGYAPPPPAPSRVSRGEYQHPPPPPPPPRAPYPVPPYSASNSFEDQGAYHHHTPHYSPHMQYPPPNGRYPSEDVNVISPNNKVASPSVMADPRYRTAPPSTPSRPRNLTPPKQYYQYPPPSPVSRPEGGLRSYSSGRRGEDKYSRSSNEKQRHGPTDSWSGYSNTHHHPFPSSRDGKNRHQAPIVADSFDSGHMSRGSHPTTPNHRSHPSGTHPSDANYHFYGGESWGSFDSGLAPLVSHSDDHRYYSSYPPPPDSPHSPYAPHFSPGPMYRIDSFPSPGYGQPLAPAFSYSFDDDNAKLLRDYNPDHDGDSMHKHVTPPGSSKKSGRSKHALSNMTDRNSVLPKAAAEIDFDVSTPPMEPIIPEATTPSCEALSEVNMYDVLCGRGGGTNSQIGNRRFRDLVQEFQPIYLLAKRKEKPLLARTIVLIIRKRGGRFLKKNEETGQLFEVGDTKAEAKTSQALREGLDVRATKSAQSLIDKQRNKKKSGILSPKSPHSTTTAESPVSSAKSRASTKTSEHTTIRSSESPPTLPRLHGDEVKVGEVHPHSPDQLQLRKRRRVRSADRFFNDFCPPRAEISQQGCSPYCGGKFGDDDEDDGVLSAPSRGSGKRDEEPDIDTRGCAGIALDIVTGAATASFCLGPTSWR